MMRTPSAEHVREDYMLVSLLKDTTQGLEVGYWGMGYPLRIRGDASRGQPVARPTLSILRTYGRGIIPAPR